MPASSMSNEAALTTAAGKAYWRADVGVRKADIYRPASQTGRNYQFLVLA